MMRLGSNAHSLIRVWRLRSQQRDGRTAAPPRPRDPGLNRCRRRRRPREGCHEPPASQGEIPPRFRRGVGQVDLRHRRALRNRCGWSTLCPFGEHGERGVPRQRVRRGPQPVVPTTIASLMPLDTERYLRTTRLQWNAGSRPGVTHRAGPRWAFARRELRPPWRDSDASIGQRRPRGFGSRDRHDLVPGGSSCELGTTASPPGHPRGSSSRRRCRTRSTSVQ
jgi:hypothetical protein